MPHFDVYEPKENDNVSEYNQVPKICPESSIITWIICVCMNIREINLDLPLKLKPEKIIYLLCRLQDECLSSPVWSSQRVFTILFENKQGVHPSRVTVFGTAITSRSTE